MFKSVKIKGCSASIPPDTPVKPEYDREKKVPEYDRNKKAIIAEKSRSMR